MPRTEPRETAPEPIARPEPQRDVGSAEPAYRPEPARPEQTAAPRDNEPRPPDQPAG